MQYFGMVVPVLWWRILPLIGSHGLKWRWEVVHIRYCAVLCLVSYYGSLSLLGEFHAVYSVSVTRIRVK